MTSYELPSSGIAAREEDQVAAHLCRPRLVNG